MLIKFSSDVGNLSMFDDIARKLLQMMGHSGTVPSALLPEDIPAALERLNNALEREAPAPAPARDEKSDGAGNAVSLRQRAHPLIELLQRAQQEGCEVTWR